MKELTEIERSALYVMRACANSDILNPFQKGIIWLVGTEQKIETERGTYTLIKFFGKLYYVD